MLPSRSGCIKGDSEGSGRVAARDDAEEECRYPLASFTAVELPRILYSWSMFTESCLPLLLSSLGRFLESSS